MKRLHVFAEGKTEQLFLNKLVLPFLNAENPSLIFTSSVIGGLVKYSIVKKEIIHKCQETSYPFVTTMFDLFRLPNSFPAYDNIRSIPDPVQKAKCLEEAMNADIGFKNFFANFTVHEFEALLFSNPQEFIKRCESKVVKSLVQIRKKFKSPEDINGGADTAPSKRIIKLHSTYKKNIDGIAIAEAIGLEKIRNECAHFSSWVSWLSNPNETTLTKQALKETEQV